MFIVYLWHFKQLLYLPLHWFHMLLTHPPVGDPAFGLLFFFFPSESQFKIRKFLKKCGKFNHHHFKQKWWWREGGSRHWQWLLMRGPCYTKCGSWISIIKSPESLLEMQDLRSTPDLLSQKLNFNKILRGFMCIAKTKKQCPKLHGIVGFINMMLEVA